jgi:acyl transferase domain-containing protein
MNEPIAIVGMACRFPPDVGSPEEFWRFLAAGGDGVSAAPPGRWEGRAGVWGGFLQRDFPDGFDAAFFGVSPREAAAMDPQQRLLLECSWEAIEDAGWAAPALGGRAIGVYIGISATDFQAAAVWGRRAETDAFTATGASLAPAAGRIACALGLEGPALAIDTACSSSLAAFHLARQALEAGECEAALAGGVNALLDPQPFACLDALGILAPDGRAKTFDASANGYVRGEGCGVVVLKPLAAAVRDGDRILAVCRGSAVNQNGASGSLTAPSGAAQARLIRLALERAGLAPGEIGYVEAHGTGTPLGDAVELNALFEVFGPGRDASDPLRIGSVKTNIGHLEAGAGVAGVIKAVECLRHGAIPPHRNLDRPNPGVPWGKYPVETPTALTPWPRKGRPRRAGVSSFGFSGTNAHVILEEAPEPAEAEQSRADRSAYLLPLSARTPEALTRLAGRYVELLKDPPASLADICYTAAVGRAHFEYRVTAMGGSAEELADTLKKVTAEVQCRAGRLPMACSMSGRELTEKTEYGVALDDAARLYEQGGEIDWNAFYERRPARRVALPTYPFERGRREAPAPAAAGDRSLLETVNAIARQALGGVGLPPLDDDLPLVQQGFSSLLGLELRARLEQALGASLPATLLYNHPSIRQIAQYLAGTQPLRRPSAPESRAGYEFLDALEADELAALIERDLNS